MTYHPFNMFINYVTSYRWNIHKEFLWSAFPLCIVYTCYIFSCLIYFMAKPGLFRQCIVENLDTGFPSTLEDCYHCVSGSVLSYEARLFHILLKSSSMQYQAFNVGPLRTSAWGMNTITFVRQWF